MSDSSSARSARTSATVLPLPPRVATREASALAEQAYVRLRDAIGSLTLPPGHRVTEMALSEWLGIGRTPVREALMRLRDEGLVEVIPRRGTFISRLSVDDIVEIYEMLEGLESMAAKLAAERATPDEIARLERAVTDQEQALARDDLAAWVEADEAFHGALLEVARNRRIQKIIEPLNAQLRRVRRLTVGFRPKPTQSTVEHRAELEAIKLGDASAAFSIHQAHRAAARPILMDIIRRLAGPNGGV